MFSVLVPLRFRSDGPIAAAIQLGRPDDTIVAAGRPWRYNAILMTIGVIIALILLYRVMRLTAADERAGRASCRCAIASRPRRSAPATFDRDRRSPDSARRPRRGGKPRNVRRPPRSGSASSRISTARRSRSSMSPSGCIQERPLAGGPDPIAEDRLLKAEGHARLLEGQLQAMSTERDKLARHIADQAKGQERPGARSQDPTGRTGSDRASGGTRRRAHRALAHAPGARRAEGAGRARPGDAGRSRRAARRGAAFAGVHGVRAERARAHHGGARRRPQRDARAAHRGAEGHGVRRGAARRSRRARQPQGVASRRAGRT